MEGFQEMNYDDIFSEVSKPLKAESSPYDAVFAQVAAPAEQPNVAQNQPESESLFDRAIQSTGQGLTNLGLGALRGAAGIGATLIRPFESGSENEARRQAIDQQLMTMGAEPDSWLYKGGKLASEVAGTAGAGGLLAKPIQALAGSTKVGNAIAQGLQTGGFRVGDLAGTIPGMATRVATGAAAGGAAAGLVNPEDAGMGAAIGGAFPLLAQAAGKAGAYLRPDPINQRLAETAKMGIDAGYVVPPNMVRPGPLNNLIESVAGKQATQQIASTQNNKVTESLVKQALGLADDVSLTKSVTESLRKTAGKAYADVSALHPMAAADNEALKVARHEASTYFTSYNRTANPEHLKIAKEAQKMADQLESTLEFYAKQADQPGLVDALRAARKQIAKTYTVDRALNDAAGTVDARVLGRLYEKGKPLSDGLEVVGQFASAFPTINKSTGQVGSPAAHNLRSMASMLMGGGAAMATGNPIGLAAAAVPWMAPAAARGLMFSGPSQRGLLSAPIRPEEIGLLTNMFSKSLRLIPAQ